MYVPHPLLICLLAACLLKPAFSLGQQNLIPNGNFEAYDMLPANASDFGLQNWYNPSGGSQYPFGTPDFLHTDGSGQSKLPMSRYGFVHPQEGGGIVGLVAYSGAEADFREYIAVELPEALVPGKRYHLSFWITNGARSHYMNGAVGQFGVCFSKQRFVQKQHDPIVAIPQVVIWEILFETGWKHVEGDFVPQEAVNHLAIGNFFPDYRTDYRDFVTDGSRGAYYFIDNVELTEIADEASHNPGATSLFSMPPVPVPATDTSTAAQMAQRSAGADTLPSPVTADESLSKKIGGRKIQRQETVSVKTRRFTISVLDARAEDGDIISLSFNGKWLLESYEIKNTPIKLDIVLEDSANNTLVFYAHNLGSTPPNTAVVTFEESGRKHAIVIESDLKRCGAITFVLDDPKP